MKEAVFVDSFAWIAICTSFEVMRMLNKAFTGDKHFEQAGYILLIIK